MTTGTAFLILGIPISKDLTAIQHAFAQKSVQVHPEEDPEGWKQLSEAYRAAKAYAKSGARSTQITGASQWNWNIQSEREVQDSGATSEEEAAFQLFSELEEETPAQISDAEKALQDYISGISSKFQSSKAPPPGRLRRLKRAMKMAEAIGYENLSDETIKLLIGGFRASCKNPRGYHSFLPLDYYCVKLRELIRQLYRRFDQLGLYDYLNTLRAEDSYVGGITFHENYHPVQLRFLLSLLVVLIALGVNVLKSETITDSHEVPIAVADYSPNLPDGTYMKVLLQSAEIMERTVYMEETTQRVKNGNNNLSLKFQKYTYDTFLEGVTTDGSVVPLCQQYSETLQSGISSGTNRSKYLDYIRAGNAVADSAAPVGRLVYGQIGTVPDQTMLHDLRESLVFDVSADILAQVRTEHAWAETRQVFLCEYNDIPKTEKVIDGTRTVRHWNGAAIAGVILILLTYLFQLAKSLTNENYKNKLDHEDAPWGKF